MRVVRSVVVLALVGGVALAQPPKPDRVRKTDAEATVVAATFLGGKGHEWLVGGGFAPDGSVVLVGNVLGPTLDVPVPVGVLGADRPAPAEPKPVAATDKGNPKVDKAGNPVFEKPSWRHEGVTAFVALCSDDLKTVKSVRRFPWAAGAATAAAVGPGGETYVAGRATDGITALGKDVAEWPAAAADDKAKGACDHAFLAKLTPTGAVEWVRHVKGASAAPTVTVSADGKQVRFGAGRLFTADPAGKLVNTVAVPGGLKPTTSVSPVDGSVVVGGEHHWATGREPWRCPILNVHTPDGKLKYQLYDWGGPLVGLDNLRQVSDSAVRFVTHDADGGILFYAWSDGGNSVMTTEPFDVRQQVKPRGLGMTAAGAGVLSCVYLVRLDPKDHHVTSWTFWSATGSNNKPNSAWVQTMARTPGGCLAATGHAAWGVWQTPGKLSDAEPWGEYVMVLSPDFSKLLYSTVVPGAGAADVTDGAGGRAAQWGVASGTVGGKTRVLFLGGAAADRADGDTKTPTPTRNAGQARFGGGWCDGYALLLELPAVAADAAPAASTAAPAGPTRASFDAAAPGKDPKKPAVVPPAGTTFKFDPASPKYVTVDFEVRDQGGKYWPNFMCGKPVSGSLTAGADGPSARFVASCPTWAQPHGDQSRRILGVLITDSKAPPPATFTLESIDPAAKTVEVKTRDNKGAEKVKTVEYHDGKATLELAGKKLTLTPRVTVRYAGAKDAPPAEAHVTAFFTLTAKDLGLTAVPPETVLDFRVTATGKKDGAK